MPAPSPVVRPTVLLILGLLLLPTGLRGQVQGEPGAPVIPAPTPMTPAAAPAPAPSAVRRAVYIEDHEALPSATAVRTDQPIEVDGNLNEPIWMSATPANEFWQYDPDEGLLYPERTEVRFLYDDDALYVGAWIWDATITTRLARKDGFANDTDIMAFYFDSYHDHRTAYRFAINPSGWRRDLIVSGGGGLGVGGITGGDTSWEPVYQVKTRIADDAWFIEMRIPFSQFRFSPADEQVWGLQIERKSRPVIEENIWSWTPSTEAGGVRRFGHLRGIRGIQPGRRLELLPYFGGKAEYLQIARNPDVDFDNPFKTGSDYYGSVGMDLKYRVTPNFILDATVNPDFGQVEVDPAVINLTAFETRFQERRPFFVEGAEIFDFGEGGPTTVYSRRIGRPPQGGAPGDAAYSFLPGATTILGAGKLTGKTADGWSIGIVDAVTQREYASWLTEDDFSLPVVGEGGRIMRRNPLTGQWVEVSSTQAQEPIFEERRHEVEPGANYFAGRVRREMRAGQTMFGAQVTAVNRLLDGSPLESRLHSAAYTGGIDFSHQWANRIWEVQAYVSPSYVAGSEDALIATQRTSSRYFQRPDDDRLVDSTATALVGYAGRVSVAKRAGAWRMNLDGSAISPTYEINDIGFQTDAGRMSTSFGGGYEHLRPGSLFRNWSVNASGNAIWNYDNDRIGTQVGLSANGQLLNQSSGGLRFNLRPETLDDRLTRGGPLAIRPMSWSASVNYGTDRRNALSASANVGFGRDDAGGWNRDFGVNMTWIASQTVAIDFGPNFSRSYGTAQYLQTVTDATATETFGRRYLFAGIDQTTLSLTARLNAVLTPLVSLEFYAQPFISSGRYESPMELAAARSYDFRTYGVDRGTMTRNASGGYVVDPDGTGPAQSFTVSNRDFNVRSLNGNAVFRWEWRPGSTLFLVWQQSRSGRLTVNQMGDDVGGFDFGRDSRGIFEIQPDNVFMIKVNYWLNP
jgi:hypothetical protein